MDLAFTLKEMDALYTEATNLKDQFGKAIESMDASIKALGTYWTSDETGTYQNFKTLFEGKKQDLIKARDYMGKFCSKVNEKRSDFATAARNVNNTIQ